MTPEVAAVSARLQARASGAAASTLPASSTSQPSPWPLTSARFAPLQRPHSHVPPRPRSDVSRAACKRGGGWMWVRV